MKNCAAFNLEADSSSAGIFRPKSGTQMNSYSDFTKNIAQNKGKQIGDIPIKQLININSINLFNLTPIKSKLIDTREKFQ